MSNFFFNESYAAERFYDNLRESMFDRDEEFDLFDRDEDIQEEEDQEQDSPES